MSEYIPELGQAAFGQPHKQYEAPTIAIAVLMEIGRELSRVMWNLKQREFISPFDNTGAKWSCDEFQVEAYSWDDDNKQSWNFKWHHVEISWYKHARRGVSSNVELTAALCAEMLEACAYAIAKYEKENSPNAFP